MRWSREEALFHLGDPAVLRDLFDVPALVIDLGPPGPPLPPAVANALRRAACVTIGVGTAVEGDGLAHSVDAVVDHDDLASLLGSIGEAPAASRTLAHVLRASENLGVTDALVVESFAYSMLLSGPAFC